MDNQRSVFHYGEDKPCSLPSVGVNTNTYGNAPVTANDVCRVKTDDEKPPSWSTFTENTTFHGIRYVFNPGTRIYRRYCVFITK